MKENLILYNTASRSKEIFTQPEGDVGMYCCGPTVYNYAHIGNLRTYVFEDVLKRALKACGFGVKHVVNITDVGHLTSDADEGEDKMEKGAKREGRTVWEIAEEYTAKFMENIRDLNIAEPDIWPKATDHIPEMLDMVKTLVDKGFTYRTGDGIYFDTAAFPAYCEFAGLDPENMRAGNRVDMGEKRLPTDFALWKFSPAGVKRQMEWESPWGTGFPGWHIECCAMSLKYLRQPVDIHCGGTDHIRVHHTNEIAQAEAATGERFVRFWVHGEFLTLDAGKMAKSEGGFITLDSVKERGIDPLAYRMFCFSAHYRSPLAFSWESLRGSEQSLENLRRLVGAASGESDGCVVSRERLEEIAGPFFASVNDDLNMPKAMAAVWDLMRRKDLTPGEKFGAAEIFDSVLALDLLSNASDFMVIKTDSTKTVKIVCGKKDAGVSVEDIFEKIHMRRKARKERHFARADKIRDELHEIGVMIRDLPDGTTECVLTKQKECV